MLDIPKGLHVLIGTFLFGLSAVFYFYISFAIRSSSVSFLKHLLKISIYFDFTFFFMLFFAFFSGGLLVQIKGYSLSTHWIEAAYFLLTLISFSWVAVFLIKIKNYKVLRSGVFKNFYHQTFFHIFSLLIILAFILIIHDAVSKVTFF